VKLSDFDYPLPKDRIAQRPLPRREDARLLVLDRDCIEHAHVRDLPRYVRAGDLWVLNDARVLPARLLGRRATGGRVEILLVERLEKGRWLAWGRANRPLKAGEVIAIAEGFEVCIEQRRGKELEVRLRIADGDEEQALERHGHVPLPPYIERSDDASDRVRYQTVFAKTPGAIAAPTAGLHLTEALLAAIEAQGAQIAFLTLFVGPGTFAPVKTERIEEHRMHAERFFVPQATADRVNEVRARGGRIVAVGTTVVRALESAADEEGRVRAGEGRTDLFIRPGYRFRIVDALLTNFHLPRSTLLMLVCAFAGKDRVLAAYREAIERNYRFFSYGDAMFIPQREDACASG